MAVSYTTLTGAKTTPGSIKYMVNYDRIDPATVLEEAQAYIFGALRVSAMKETATLSLTAGTTFRVAEPDGFLEAISLNNFLGDPPFAHVSKSELDGRRRLYTTAEDGTLEEGEPSAFACAGGWIEFDCLPEENRSLRLQFYSSAQKLSETTDTNFLCTRYPHLLTAACRAYAFLHMENDGQAKLWMQRTDEAIARANVEADFGRGLQPMAVVV